MNDNEKIKLEKVAIDDFAKIKYLSNITYAKDGSSACFVVSNSNLKDNKYESFIYCKKGENIFKLTGLGKESNFFYLNNDTIIFRSNREKEEKEGLPSTKLYAIHLNGGEASLYLDLPMNAQYIKVLKNEDILFTSAIDPLHPDLYQASDEEKQAYLKEVNENKDYEEITESPWWFNGGSFLKGARTNLFIYKKEDKKIEKLTPSELNVGNIYLSDNEDFCIFSGSSGEKLLDIFNSDYYLYTFETKELKKIIDKETIDINSEIGFLQDKFYVFGNTRQTGVNTDCDIYSFDKEGTLKLEKKFAQSIHSSVGSDVRFGGGKSIKFYKDSIYFVSTQYDSAILLEYNAKKNKISEVITKNGSIDSFDIQNDKILLIALYDMNPLEVYEYDLKKKDLIQVTHFNTNYVSSHFISKPEQLFFQSKNDLIHGFVLKPINYDETKKYPVIIDIHGGPKTVYGEVFYHEMQYWCSEGYFVIYCNPTGGDGRGRKFADIRGKYGTIDFIDIMAFCDEALAKYPQMDQENFFETGGSYGGFMTNWIIGHTDRFKACASQRSISDWISFYGISDIGSGFATDQTAGDIWKNFNKIWWHSPLKYADQVKTPTLFIHSECDYRCPVNQGMEMFTALLAHGVDAKLVYFRGENHELSRSGLPKHRIKRLSEITGWFNKYLSSEYKNQENK